MLRIAVRKLRLMGRLIITTPSYRMVLALQLASGLASFAGLPMLVPVLDSMSGQADAFKDNRLIGWFEGFLNSVGWESSFYPLLGAASLLIFIGYVLNFLSNLIAANAQVEISRCYRRKLFSAYSKADWLWIVGHKSGEMNFSVLREAELAGTAHLTAQRVLIYFIQICVLLAVTIRLSAGITALAIAVYAVVGFFGALNSREVHRLAARTNRTNKRLANELNSMQQNKKFFKTSLLNERILGSIHGYIDSVAADIRAQNIRVGAQHTFSLMVTFIFLVGLMGSHDYLNLSYSVLLLILLVFVKIAPQFSHLIGAYATMDKAIPIYESIQKRLEEFQQNEENNGTKEYNPDFPISFENVGFDYPNGHCVFDGLTLTIEPRSTVAFAGPSGVGKSTLLDLLLSLLKPTRGGIFYGSVEQENLDKRSLRGRVAYVSQETTLIDGTLRDNLTICVPEYDEDKLQAIVEKVGLADTVRRMPLGLDTPVGENGIQLSGGQRQRVALARALFMDPGILILDEATSSLDPKTESHVLTTIQKLKGDFTILLVTHKLSSVRIADRIYLLEGGRVTESGSYDDLIRQQGSFFALSGEKRA